MYSFTNYFKSNWLLLTLLLSIVCIADVSAQQIAVRGVVTSASDGTTLPGVSVRLKGGNAGTSTAADGSYRLNVPSNGTIIFTFVGFTTAEVPVDGRSVINVQLREEAQSLNEVVVVGYGTTRKSDLTGSVAVVSSRDFQKGNITTPEQLIVGKVPGVSITSNSGQPGAGSTIRIRGGSSLNASNDPLIVIDGVPLENSSVSGAANPLSFINPNDIESFTVLKDASAAAIYGARAANGVIIITTKKGVDDRLRVTFNTVNSVSDVARYVDVLSADQIRTIVNEHGSANLKARLGTANTNWQKEIYQAAFGTDNSLGISGGIKNLPYRLSLGYQNQSGVLRTDNLQKGSLALVLNPSFFDKHLSLNVNLKGNMQRARFANTAAIGGAVSFDPTQPIRTNSPRFGGYFEHLDPTIATGLANLQGRNPLGLLYQREDIGTPVRSIGNIQVDYKFHFLPELRANLNLGYDIARGKGTVFVTDSAAAEYIVGGAGGLNNRYQQNRNNTLLDFYLNYSKEIKSIKSRVDVTTGYSYNDFKTKFFNFASYNARGEKFPNSDPIYPYDIPQNRLISVFGRANYSYDDKYLLTATLRRDGSSRFGADYKYGLFPSLALAWTIANEPFLKQQEVISDLKLRVGYGVTGQQEGIPNYGYLASYNLSQNSATYQFGNTYYQMYRPSGYVSDIRWEETSTTNIAIDYGFLNNRISGSIEYYYKKTKDLLANAPQAAGTNFSATAFQNIGNMENRGVEFSITAQPIRSTDFRWDASFNITYNKNKITNLTLVPNDPNYLGAPTGGIASGVGGQTSQLHAVGGSRNTFYLLKQVYDESGKPIDGVFEDLNGDGLITLNDRYLSKSAMPDYFLGYSNNITYKKWSTSFVLRANIGNYAYNNNYSATGTLRQVTGSPVIYNASANYLETGFRGSDFQILSDYYLQNASFLKMDNLSLTYNAGQLFNQRANLQVSGIVQNVFTITKYKGLDPEVGSGVDANLYPRPRVFSVGLNLSY
ncbi:SusC/RagA family TonB-linked outer membrane protein [Pedobacter sp. SYSU D00535]|uniref:SusC/RagA family TonB-linked outer membrane protein n=1 Tax=Pedobacter sp. SYSU D00535 TaxID=2810308 RepID=UPI001A97098C|nr:SusC/RagA family TonB-linked outer membrane protein [Pedobacter sp. SYSU D00535]